MSDQLLKSVDAVSGFPVTLASLPEDARPSSDGVWTYDDWFAGWHRIVAIDLAGAVQPTAD